MTDLDDAQFDPNAYLDELIEEMGLQSEAEEKRKSLKEAMYETLWRELIQAAQENVDPEVIDMVMEDLKDEEDGTYILWRIVRESPTAQIAMLEALETFRENTLEAFNKLKI